MDPGFWFGRGTGRESGGRKSPREVQGLTLKSVGLFKVIKNGAVRQTINFLLVRHCNYSSILYRSRVI